MSAKKIIAVVGATGAQGGGLARAILDDANGDFSVRALTRRPDSDPARALADAGADVVRADLDDPDTVEAAFDGAYGAFCVTNFWESFSPEKEKAQAQTMAEAAAATGLKHVIWSTLDDTRERIPLDDDQMPTLMGEYKVPHFDAKGESNAYFRASGAPTTFLLTCFYWDNFLESGMGPQRGEDGVARIVLPLEDAKLPGIAAADIGKCAYGIFRRGPGELAGETIGIAGGHPTGREMARVLSDVLDETVEYLAVSPADYRGFGFPGAEDLGNMFQYKQEFNEAFCAARPVEETRELNPELLDFEAWARKHAGEIEVSDSQG